MYDEVGPKLNHTWKDIITADDQYANYRKISSYKIHKNLHKH